MANMNFCVILLTNFILLLSVKANTSYPDWLLSRSKRSSNYDLVSAHSVCAAKSPDATESGVSDEEKKKIVDLHNKHRSEVTPTATNMLKMRWNDEVALIAQKWADSCNKNHDTGSERGIPALYSVGQNLAFGNEDFTSAINVWHKENELFTYGGAIADFHLIAHYTAIVWATTNLIGCGYAKCGDTKHYVCNYAPAGNLNTLLKTPYKSGTSCSECSGNCENNLCVCENTCWHGTKMNPADCTCECMNSMYKAPNCKLDCEDADPSTGGYSCSGGFGDNIDCNNFFSKRRCPHKCNFCPSADFRVVEKATPTCGKSTGTCVVSSFLLFITFLAYYFIA